MKKFIILILTLGLAAWAGGQDDLDVLTAEKGQITQIEERFQAIERQKEQLVEMAAQIRLEAHDRLVREGRLHVEDSIRLDGKRWVWVRIAAVSTAAVGSR